MKLVSFNINGIKARGPALTRWLDSFQPDVLVMQEIKSVDDAFPREIFEERGYTLETHGQKGFNGVAIASLLPLRDVSRGLPGDDDDAQARYMEATVEGPQHNLRVCGLYLPNGNPVELDEAGAPVAGGKYAYKLAWMERLRARAEALLAAETPFVMLGDYNIIPQAEDAARPKAWENDALYRLPSREAFRSILNLGLTDALRARTQAPESYTFWDYQAGAWDRNDGIRIDHILLCPYAADWLVECGIDRAVRGEEKPSDHVPIWAEMGV
ncbi:MAG: exodeoxyribonuclease III [Rhodobacteraceae bacterium]|nr:exodeoxyribonuclease III [Paracoccaceae bacterium]